MFPFGHVLAGKYRTIRTLGQGGFGVVVEAEHIGHGGRVAIKLLRAELATQETVIARFLREARALASLRGDHVARILDVSSGTNEHAPFIVMERLQGNDLGKLVAARGALAVTDAVDHVLQACMAISEAHALGLVHRDIKPSNLFLTTRNDGSPCIKVLDFGIAKAMPHPTDAPSITRTQDVVGTPLYMAPEQMRSAKIVDQRTDVWALGATLYELLSGRPAFGGATMSEIYAMVLTESPAPLPATIPAPLALAIARCLEKKPDARFASVASFAAAIAAYGSGRVSSPPMPTSTPLPVSSFPPVALPETMLVQPHTVALDTLASRPRTRAPFVAMLGFVVAVVAVLGATRLQAQAHVAAPRVAAATPETPVVVAPDVTITPASLLEAPTEAPPAASTPVKRVAKPKKAAETPKTVAETPKTESPRGVATSRFE